MPCDGMVRPAIEGRIHKRESESMPLEKFLPPARFLCPHGSALRGPETRSAEISAGVAGGKIGCKHGPKCSHVIVGDLTQVQIGRTQS